MIRTILCALILASCCQVASAVIVAGNYATSSDGTVNTSPPADDPGFYNVGTTGTASAIYLGSNGLSGYWVLSAKHVTLTATTFSFPDPANPSHIDSATYNIVPNSAVVLPNPSGAFQGTTSDLILYRIDPNSSSYGAPNLPTLNIASSAPTAASGNSPGATVYAVGNGIDRASSLTYWDNSLPTWQPTTSTLAQNAGYSLSGGEKQRWGDNTVSQSGSDLIYNVGSSQSPVYIHAFTTTFSSNQALDSEFQVTYGDSGGGVFSKVDGSWMLSGMIDAYNFLSGQPTNTAAFGDTSVMADLSAYRSEIMAYVPEPATGGMALAAFLTAVAGFAVRRLQSTRSA